MERVPAGGFAGCRGSGACSSKLEDEETTRVKAPNSTQMLGKEWPQPSETQVNDDNQGHEEFLSWSWKFVR